MSTVEADTYVLLWSHRQGALHVEALAEHLRINRLAAAHNLPGDYRLLHMGARAEVDAWADKMRRAMTEGRAAA